MQYVFLILVVWAVLGLFASRHYAWELDHKTLFWNRKQKAFAYFLLGPFWWIGSFLEGLTSLVKPVFFMIWNWLGKEPRNPKTR